MTRTEQRRFIRELISSVRASLLQEVPRVPEKWDGHELRQWIADRFDAQSYTLKRDRRRYKDYQNERLVRNI